MGTGKRFLQLVVEGEMERADRNISDLRKSSTLTNESEAEHSDRHNKKPAEQEKIEGNSSKKGKESYKKAREKEHDRRKQSQNDSSTAIISTNRITRSLGIYNKAKRSDTISRENAKKNLFTKKFEDVRTRTERDMARVLDCSSFKIQLSCGLPSCQDSPVDQCSGRMDYPVLSLIHRMQSPVISHKSQRSESSCSSSGRYSNPDKNKITPLRRSTPRRKSPLREAGLAFKTPLQEISQTLTETLRPSETFHGRDYLAEIQGQIRKMYRQSSVNSHAQRMESNAGIACEFQKRCLKRRSAEGSKALMTASSNEEKIERVVEGPSDHLLSSNRESTSELLVHKSVSNETFKQQERLQQTVLFRASNRKRESIPLNDHLELDKFPSTVRSPGSGKETDISCGRNVQRCLFGQKEPFLHKSGQALTFSHNSDSPDILDFLDGVEHVQQNKECITPDARLVSPPKKPTLDSLTPEKKFYPHKLY
ncbi:uncharacterized protein [Montipora capricornis]|uniref:uncharacterized protein n=1 Tax=Montipora capricornis TaxID=246305 RepID=UPI0035F129B7